MMKAKAKPQRQRFPHLCENGASCPFLACGTCWFSHDADAKCTKDISTNDTENEKLQHQVDKKIAATQSTMDKKMTGFSKYVEKRLSEVDAKLEALAEAFIKDEADSPTLLENDLRPNSDVELLDVSQVQAIKFDVIKGLSATFQDGVRRSLKHLHKSSKPVWRRSNPRLD